jgi:dTDP-4-dehydrorhamnose 3,5-epimerase
MKVTRSVIPGVLIIKPRAFGDARGFFYESFNQQAFNEVTGLNLNFVHMFGKWVGLELNGDKLLKT